MMMFIILISSYAPSLTLLTGSWPIGRTELAGMLAPAFLSRQLLLINLILTSGTP